ncbi:hypothetical protein B0O99DRAFT_689957 [Bisporella sp. PMI_857]|nr:hypothetical protein B0O99DRAFT_689957 [Bisporella sp. PMI_857]
MSSFAESVDAGRELLEEYGRVPPEDVISHVLAVYQKAINHADVYPCVTNYRFLRPLITEHPLYHETILPRLLATTITDPNAKTKPPPQTILDMGCCFGQDLRALAYAGVPGASLYGVDLHPEYLSLGYALYRDSHIIPSANMIAGDIFDAAGPFDVLKGKMDMIHIISFLHLFSYEDQVKACTRMVQFLRPLTETDTELDGPLIFGRQTGSIDPGTRIRELSDGKRTELFIHSAATFERLWKEVGELTGTRWRVIVVEEPIKKNNRGRVSNVFEPLETVRILVFSVVRVEPRKGGGFFMSCLRR